MKIRSVCHTFAALLMSCSALANYQNIPQDQLSEYKTATILAGLNSSLTNCSQSGILKEESLDQYIKNADSGKIDSDGNQPILVFEKNSLDNGVQSKVISTVRSSSDYKKIISIKVEELSLSDVNIGDLRHPHIVKSYVVKSSAECK